MLSKICNAIKRLLRREDKFVGRDENGNSYYESSKGKGGLCIAVSLSLQQCLRNGIYGFTILIM